MRIHMYMYSVYVADIHYGTIQGSLNVVTMTQHSSRRLEDEVVLCSNVWREQRRLEETKEIEERALRMRFAVAK